MLWGSDNSGNLRHRIISGATPGITSEYSPDGQIEPFDRAVLQDGLSRIFAACGRKPARRAQQRGNAQLIESYGQDQ